MKGYIAFVKKEIIENIRTFKLLILFAVFFIFGMMSPLAAKLTPEILKNFVTEGISFTIPDPTAIDSYMQFFKNNGQMGLLVLVLVFGGTLTSEYSKGTLINILTKGLSRKTVILAKFTVASLLWTFSIIISAVTTYGYTVYLFPNDKVYNVILSIGSLWLFGIFLIAAIIFASTFVKSSYSCLLIVVIVITALFMINIAPAAKPYNPIYLASMNVNMLAENFDFADAVKSAVVTVVLIIGMLMASLTLFDRKRI